MKAFMDEDFLLGTETARMLYYGAAKDQPIWDYHCHLSPQEIADDRQFETLTDIWLGGDHYKWRQMRTAGIPEKYITGNAAPYDKFMAWASTVERLIGNPLYHWTHLELQRYFDIYEPLTTRSAPDIWERANALLSTPDLSVSGIFRKMNVYAVGTTDDPADTLEHHRLIASGKAKIGKVPTKVVPSFRPDKALYIEQATFAQYMATLGAAADSKADSPEAVLAALEKRLVWFKECGCRATDTALPVPPLTASPDDRSALEAEKALAHSAFAHAMNGEQVSPQEVNAWRAFLLTGLAAMYRTHGLAMQLHFGATRSNNPVMLKAVGPDTGFDACDDQNMAVPLSTLLGRIEAEGGLPRTIIYSLNPKDYQAIATLMGAFQGPGMSDEYSIAGKIQLGAAWWFCDHKEGMETQLKALASLGMLSTSVGMLTDSRSFLSYPRHEYFRRILCNLTGSWVENGEYPADMDLLTDMIQDISFGNAHTYFAD